jgi:hypothetical protein
LAKTIAEYTKIERQNQDVHQLLQLQHGHAPRSATKSGGVSYTNYSQYQSLLRVGMDVSIFKYTGYLTDNLTLTALVGRRRPTRAEHLRALTQHAASYCRRRFPRTWPDMSRTTGTTGNLRLGANDTQKAIASTWNTSSVSHDPRRSGRKRISLMAGASTAGQCSWIYGKQNDQQQSQSSTSGSPASDGGLGLQGYFVERDRSATLSTHQL